MSDDPLPLRDRVAIVTGGGRNVGRGVARALAAAGARVLVAGRTEARLRETEGAIVGRGGRCRSFACDLTDAAQAEAMARAALDTWGRIDVLAAMAGGGSVAAPVTELDPAAFDAVYRQNVLTAFHAIRAVLPSMLAQGRGSIVTAVGGGAFFPVVGAPACAYAVAKAAVCRMTDQVQAEHLGTGVRINALEPGVVLDTAGLAELEVEERAGGAPAALRAGPRTPEAAGELAVWLASDASAEVCGRLVSVNDTWWRDPAAVRAVARSLPAYRLWRHGGP